MLCRSRVVWCPSFLVHVPRFSFTFLGYLFRFALHFYFFFLLSFISFLVHGIRVVPCYFNSSLFLFFFRFSIAFLGSFVPCSIPFRSVLYSLFLVYFPRSRIPSISSIILFFHSSLCLLLLTPSFVSFPPSFPLPHSFSPSLSFFLSSHHPFSSPVFLLSLHFRRTSFKRRNEETDVRK